MWRRSVLGCEDSMSEFESRWDEGRRLDFDIGRRRLECLKQWEWYWESD